MRKRMCCLLLASVLLLAQGCTAGGEAGTESTEPQTEATQPVTGTIAVTETETTEPFAELYYQMAVLGSSSAVSESKYGLSAYIPRNGRDLTGSTYYALTFAVWCNQLFTVTVTDAGTGEELSNTDFSHLYSYQSYAGYKAQPNGESPVPNTGWLEVGTEADQLTTYVLESFEAYTIEDIAVTIHTEGGDFEISCNAGAADFEGHPPYTILASLLEINGSYYVADNGTIGFGTDNSSIAYTVANLICVSDFYSGISTGLSAADVKLIDGDTGEDIVLPDGVSYYLEETADGNEIELCIGVEVTGNYAGDFKDLRELVKTAFPVITVSDGAAIILS